MKLVVLALASLPLILMGCGGGKSKDSHNHETMLELPTHNADQCPKLEGKYKGTAQNRKVIYEFKKVEKLLVAVIKIPDVSKDETSVVVNGKGHKTPVGQVAFGCENGKLNSSSVINDQKNKAKFVLNDDGFELQEELPKAATSQFYKMVD